MLCDRLESRFSPPTLIRYIAEFVRYFFARLLFVMATSKSAFVRTCDRNGCLSGYVVEGGEQFAYARYERDLLQVARSRLAVVRRTTKCSFELDTKVGIHR
jgi:hypothetical protein